MPIHVMKEKAKTLGRKVAVNHRSLQNTGFTTGVELHVLYFFFVKYGGSDLIVHCVIAEASLKLD